VTRSGSIHLITPFFKKHRWQIAAGILCLIVVDFLQLLIPRVIKWTVDGLTGYAIGSTGLLTYAGYIVIIAAFIGMFRYIWRRCLIGTSRIIEEGLRLRLFDHIQTLSSAYFDRTTSGDLMAHATNDIQHVRMAVGMGMVALTDSIVLGISAIAFMAYINITLTMYVLIPAPFIIVGTRLFSRRMHHSYRAVQGTFADMTEAVRERFAGIRIVKAYTAEQASSNEISSISREYVAENIKLVRVTGFFFPMMLFFSNLGMVIVLYLGGRLTIDQTITPGDFVAFISYIGLLTWPMMAMGWVTNLIQRGKASLERIDRILQTTPDVPDAPDGKPLSEIDGHIEFKNVSFNYPGTHRPALKNISLTLNAGSTLGVVGPPGSGKTTLLRLIPRLYDVGTGMVLLDGTDIRSIRLSDLRSQIAYVPQEPFLFSGTIEDNILAGGPVSGSDIVSAAEKAALRRTVEHFPNQWDTIVGEKGVILSGGQKQRVALARALIRTTPILILDDPISQVDVATGTAIMNAIQDMVGSRTIIIVSHRISAVRFADTIVVMDQGQIAAKGSHEELTAFDNFYTRTFRLQQLEEETCPQTVPLEPPKPAPVQG